MPITVWDDGKRFAGRREPCTVAEVTAEAIIMQAASIVASTQSLEASVNRSIGAIGSICAALS
jgi:hypothetical protein